jgi:hypothetical protein
LWLTLNGAGELAYYMPLNERDEYWQIKTLSFKQPKAGVANHIAVCEFLRYLRDAYFPSLVVYDEANYFESGDPLRAYTAIQEPDTPAL